MLLAKQVGTHHQLLTHTTLLCVPSAVHLPFPSDGPVPPAVCAAGLAGGRV